MTQPTQTIHIQAYSLLEYTQKLNEALNEGYELKLDTNEGTCQHIGFYFEVLMYKKPEIVPEEVPLVKVLWCEPTVPTVQPQKQRGRPSAK